MFHTPSPSFIHFSDNMSFLVAQQLWVALTMYHASLLISALPHLASKFGTILAVVIGLKHGHVSSESSCWLEMSPILKSYLFFLTILAYMRESIDDLWYERYGFWVLIALNATEVSQILLPMLLVFRPWHSTLVIVVLSLTSQQVVWEE